MGQGKPETDDSFCARCGDEITGEDAKWILCPRCIQIEAKRARYNSAEDIPIVWLLKQKKAEWEKNKQGQDLSETFPPAQPGKTYHKVTATRQGKKVTIVSDEVVYRGQEHKVGEAPPRETSIPNNNKVLLGSKAPQAEHTLAHHVAGPNNGGEAETKFISTTKDLHRAAEFAEGRKGRSEGVVYAVEYKDVKRDSHAAIYDISNPEKAQQTFGNSRNDPEKSAAAFGPRHEEVTIKPGKDGLMVTPSVDHVTAHDAEPDQVSRGYSGPQDKHPKQPSRITKTIYSVTIPTKEGIVQNSVQRTEGQNMHSSVLVKKTDMAKQAVYAAGVHCSASSGVCDIIDRWGNPAYADANHLSSYSGVITTTTRKIALAQAGVANYTAGTANGIASACLSVATASASASMGYDGFSAQANATLVSASGQLGPANATVGLNLNTGASVGLGGVGLNVLGFGFNVGPTIKISTPIFSFSLGF